MLKIKGINRVSLSELCAFEKPKLMGGLVVFPPPRILSRITDFNYFICSTELVGWRHFKQFKTSQITIVI